MERAIVYIIMVRMAKIHFDSICGEKSNKKGGKDPKSILFSQFWWTDWVKWVTMFELETSIDFGDGCAIESTQIQFGLQNTISMSNLW